MLKFKDIILPMFVCLELFGYDIQEYQHNKIIQPYKGKTAFS